MIPSTGPEFSSDNAGDGPNNNDLDNMPDVLDIINKLREDTNNSSNGLDGKTFQLKVLSIISSVVHEMRDTKSHNLIPNKSLDSCLKDLREEAEKSTNGVEAKSFQLQVLTIISLVVKEMRESRAENLSNQLVAHPCLTGAEMVARLDDINDTIIDEPEDSLNPARPLSQDTEVAQVLAYDAQAKQPTPDPVQTDDTLHSNNGMERRTIDILSAIQTAETKVSQVVSEDVQIMEVQTGALASKAIQVVQLQSTEVNSEEDQKLNTALLNFKASQPDPSKKPSWVVSEGGNEKCIHCKCLVDSRYYVHEMGKKHRKIKKHGGTEQHASLLFIASELKDTLKKSDHCYRAGKYP